MIVKINGVDPLFISMSLFMGFTNSPWWLTAIPVVIASWFLNPTWSRKNGWRFFHDQ